MIKTCILRGAAQAGGTAESGRVGRERIAGGRNQGKTGPVLS